MRARLHVQEVVPRVVTPARCEVVLQELAQGLRGIATVSVRAIVDLGPVGDAGRVRRQLLQRDALVREKRIDHLERQVGIDVFVKSELSS